MIDILINAEGLVPRGAPRPKARVIRDLGKPRAQIYVPKEADEWKRAFRRHAAEVMPAEALDEPVRVDVLALFPRPQRLNRRKDPDGLVWHTTTPDRDNVDKLVLDALAPYWRDDTDVVLGTILKAYHRKGGQPGVIVRIRSAALFHNPQQVAEQLGLVPPTGPSCSEATHS